MKPNCVKCGVGIIGDLKANYQERGNWCRACDIRASVVKKPNITFFINLAKQL